MFSKTVSTIKDSVKYNGVIETIGKSVGFCVSVLVVFALIFVIVTSIMTVFNPPQKEYLPDQQFVVIDTYSETYGMRGNVQLKMICENEQTGRVTLLVPDNLSVIEGDKVSISSYMYVEEFHWDEITLIDNNT